jgi:hypothetical protein
MKAVVRNLAAAVGLALVMGLGASAANAQQILLDKSVKAGELTLFPELNNESVFYYVPDKVRLATDANGTPQFSFLRYVENVRSAADAPEAREGEGGGIVHALVTLGVTPEQLRDAQSELQRVRPGGRIQGPIIFKAGRFGLVSAFTDTKGNLSKQVVGLGSAPLLDGEKAAISMQLTKLGAKLLWESFNMPAPDISFRFEMDMSGYRAPKRATIDADWSKIYEHRAFGAGFASTYLSAEVKDAYDELKTNDAIKITQIGEDDKMDALVQTAYKMIEQRMFEPVGGTGTPSLTDMSGMGGTGQQTSLLDRATAHLKEARAEVAAENADIRKDNDATRARNDKALAEQGAARRTKSNAENADRAAMEAEAKAQLLERRAKVAARLAAQPPNIDGLTTDSVLVAANTAAINNAKQEAAALQKEAATAKAEATRMRQEADKVAQAGDSGAVPHATEALKAEKDKPTFSIMASLEMKKVKQTGKFHYDLNKYTPENITLSFSENIGDLRRLKDDASHFRSVNLDDPMFKQRELVAMVDGVNAQDFGQFVNFASVQMRKKHESGEETQDEVRIDRNNFNKEGNAFKLMYGWKGDNDRRKWMDYEVQTTWSLFGGKTIVEPWKKVNAGAIGLTPPLRRRFVNLDGSQETLQQADVRAVTVQVFYDVAGAEQSKQVSLNVAKGQVADKIEILTSPDNTNYAYQLTWQLKGNRTVTSGRQTTVSDNLFVDELPTTAAKQ